LDDRCPPQSLSVEPGWQPRVAASCPPPVRLAVPSKAPRRADALWVWRSHLVVHPPRGLRPPGAKPCERLANLPRPFAPLRSVTRTPVTPSSGAIGSLEVSSPSTQPNRDEPPPPELPPPGPVASPPFQPASTPFSRRDLPGVFHPGAPSGFSLQSLTWQGLHAPLDAASLPAIGNGVTRPIGDTDRRAISPAPRPCSIASRLRRVVRRPDRRCPIRVRPGSGLGVRNGLAARVLPPCRLEDRFRVSTVPRPSGSPGLLPPWGIPLPGTWPRRPSLPPPSCDDGPRDDPGIMAPMRVGLRRRPGLPRSASSPVLRV
jgi:hypothetical protein